MRSWLHFFGVSINLGNFQLKTDMWRPQICFFSIESVVYLASERITIHQSKRLIYLTTCGSFVHAQHAQPAFTQQPANYGSKLARVSAWRKNQQSGECHFYYIITRYYVVYMSWHIVVIRQRVE